MIPYGRHSVDQSDIDAVVAALKSDFLTTGNRVSQFEGMFAHCVGAEFAVSLSSGTAALHAAMNAVGIGPGDAVVVPTMTFVATAHAVVACGGVPLFCDVNPDTLLIDFWSARQAIKYGRGKGYNVKAIIAVDYAGQPCDYSALRTLADDNGLVLVADAAHSLGASYKALRVGTLADLTCFSFHPLKTITTGEGGMITTASAVICDKIKRFRNLGRDSVADVVDLGLNYRLTDIQCALGMSQLAKMAGFLARRRVLAERYDRDLLECGGGVRPLTCEGNRSHSFHLYVVKLRDRDLVKARLSTANVGTQIHYRPVHTMPYYVKFCQREGLSVSCPNAERASREILSLPIFPGLTAVHQNYVIDALKGVLNG